MGSQHAITIVRVDQIQPWPESRLAEICGRPSVAKSPSLAWENGMNRHLFKRVAFALSASIAVSASAASAASYGNFSSPGGTVSFLNVGDVNGLFGAPTVGVNGLGFGPDAFEADCSMFPCSSTQEHIVADTLTLDIEANDGSFVHTIVFSEAGEATVVSFLSGIAAAGVVSYVFIEVLEIDGAAVTGIDASAWMSFTPSEPFNGLFLGGGTKLWTGFLSIDVGSVIASNDSIGNATLVRVSLTNTVFARTSFNTVARIQKDGLTITVVPEPGAALLMGLGLIGLTASGRGIPNR